MSNTANSPNPHSAGGLEVVPNTNQQDPEVYYPSTEAGQTQAYTTGHQQSYGKDHAPNDRLMQGEYHRPASYGPASPPQDGTTPGMATALPPPPSYKKICGVRPVTFILALLLMLVIVLAAVGGGVGGTFAVRDAYEYVSENSSPHFYPSDSRKTRGLTICS